MRFQSIRLFPQLWMHEYDYQTVRDTVLMFVLKQLNSPSPLYLKLGEVSLERKILPPSTLWSPSRL